MEFEKEKTSAGTSYIKLYVYEADLFGCGSKVSFKLHIHSKINQWRDQYFKVFRNSCAQGGLCYVSFMLGDLQLLLIKELSGSLH